MARKKPGPGQDGYQEVIPASQLFAALTSPDPSYNKHRTMLYLYICPRCGWWEPSTGVDEVFGSLVQRAGPRTAPCEECQYAPMQLVKRGDKLAITVDAQPLPASVSARQHNLSREGDDR